MPTVRFVNEGLEVECEEGANLRTVAQEADIQIYDKPFHIFNCKGFGHCGTCRVRVKQGNDTSNMSIMEKIQFYVGWPMSVIPLLNFLDFVGKEDELRLSCQLTVEQDMTVETRPAVNFFGEEDWEYDLDNPAIAGNTREMEPPTTAWEKGEMQDLEE
ncbi:MAG: 2Fe-2S iron-sulfur cluster-binding protein [bacterium]